MKMIFSRFASLSLLIFFINPAVADSLVPVEYYASLPLVEQPRLSPNGKNIAVKQSYMGSQKLFLYVEGETSPFAYSSGDAADVNWFRWASNDRLLLGVGLPHKGQFEWGYYTRLLAMDPDGTNLFGLHNSRLYNREWSGDDLISILPDDPNHILMEVLGVAKRFNIYTGKKKKISPDLPKIGAYMADGDGTIRLRWGYRDEKARFDFRETADDKFKPLLRFEIHKSETFYPIYFGPEPHLIWVKSRTDGKLYKILEYDTRTEQYTRTIHEHDEVDSASLLLSGDRRSVVGAYSIDDKYEPVYFDPEAKRFHENLDQQFPGATNWVVSRSHDEDTVIIRHGSDVQPAIYYQLVLSQGTILPIGLAYPKLEGVVLSPMQPIEFEARDGVKIRGYLTVPIGAETKNLPLVLLPHGGPHSRDSIAFQYRVQQLASRGYAILQVNYRGSKGFGLDFEKMGWKQWGMAMQDDLTDATQWAINQGIADADRICIVGSSYGGYAALMGVIKTPKLFKCAASFAGVIDLDKHVHWRKRWTSVAPYLNNDIKENSPHSRYDEIETPLLIAHGVRDWVVDYRQAKKFVKKLRKNDADVTFLTFELGDHYLSREQNRLEYATALDAFLQKHLGLGQHAYKMDRPNDDLRELQQQMVNCINGIDSFEDKDWLQAKQQLGQCNGISSKLSPDLRLRTANMLARIPENTVASTE